VAFQIKNIYPMLAKSSSPFDSDGHIFEFKWDGTRCIAFVDRMSLRLQNRRLIDITELQSIRDSLKAKSAVIDGEIVVLSKGKSSTEKLQQREHIGDHEKIEILSGLIPTTYIVFDLIYLNGQSIMKKPLIERRRLLHELFSSTDNILFSEGFTKGKALLKEALKHGFEGIMAKEKMSPYLPGERSGYWLKIKKSFDIDAVVCGYLEGYGDRTHTSGSLVMGVHDSGTLIHIGQVGTGFDASTIEMLSAMLSKIRTDKCPFQKIPEMKRRVFWTKPQIVIRAGYQELTKDRKLRVPRFERIRYDKSPDECTIDQ
jgi:bifunctional non-homologous end joining protein LigD